MRMCYLSISHTNVFSVTVPPGRLQEGSGALIKAAFAGQECGLLRLGVAEGLGVCSTEPLLNGQLVRDWARGQLCLAVIRHFPLSLAFPQDLLHHHVLSQHIHMQQYSTLPCACVCTCARAHAQTHTNTHPLSSPLCSLLSSVLFLLSSFTSSVPGCSYASQQPLHSQLCPEADSRNHTAPPLVRPKAPR